MDDLEAQNNVLHEEIAYLKDELTAERDKHNNDSDLQRRYDNLVTVAKPVLKNYVESL